ncbi:hypothetical protein G6F40_014379 [Rhizopus arrhizus]|nr:hypothetical protein G6F40_014379 [Rhizopus arrhizus]
MATVSADWPWAWTATWRSGTSTPPPTWSIALDSTRCTRAWCADSPTCLPPGATHEQHPGSSPRPRHSRPVAAGLSRFTAGTGPGRAAGGACQCRGRGRHRRQGRAGVWHQHRLRQAGQCAHLARGPGHPAAEHRALACGRRRRTNAGQRGALDDGAEAGQPCTGCFGHPRGHPAAAGSDAGQGRAAGGARTGLGGCFGRPGTALAPGQRDAGRGRSLHRRRTPAGRRCSGTRRAAAD